MNLWLKRASKDYHNNVWRMTVKNYLNRAIVEHGLDRQIIDFLQIQNNNNDLVHCKDRFK
ncbi:hypothetical protein L3i20_v212040 [Paenibacillus sp. L3-i20]|nr:hypothetical protein L3i20_v212040 [Paenibacillus sp. L3-i20]